MKVECTATGAKRGLDSLLALPFFYKLPKLNWTSKGLLFLRLWVRLPPAVHTRLVGNARYAWAWEGTPRTPKRWVQSPRQTPFGRSQRLGRE